MNFYIFIILIFFNFHSKAFSLRFIDARNIPAETEVDGHQFGGLSGLVYNEKKQKFYAISDDPSLRSPSRIYSFSMKITKDYLKIYSPETLLLKKKNGSFFEEGELDAEGIQITEDESFIISTEGQVSLLKTIPPSIQIFNKEGVFFKEILPPKDFFPSKDRGIRKNRGFESLFKVPNKDIYYTLLEQPLKQDGPAPDFSKTASLRLLEIKNGAFTKQFRYEISKAYLKNLPQGKNFKIEHRVSDALMINDNTFLTLEISYSKKYGKNVKIYKVFLDDKKSMKENNFLKTPFLDKELVADLDSFLEKVPLGHQDLDNLEGMAFGPRLENGHKTLIFVSDDNFSKKQRTQFLAFEIIE